MSEKSIRNLLSKVAILYQKNKPLCIIRFLIISQGKQVLGNKNTTLRKQTSKQNTHLNLIGGKKPDLAYSYKSMACFGNKLNPNIPSKQGIKTTKKNKTTNPATTPPLPPFFK